VSTDLIDTVERDGGRFLTESESKAQLVLNLLRTRKVNLTQVPEYLHTRHLIDLRTFAGLETDADSRWLRTLIWAGCPSQWCAFAIMNLSAFVRT